LTVYSVPSSSSSWIVIKFGGTSVASLERWQKIEQITRRHLSSGHRVLVVCSALTTVTDRLTAVAHAIDHGESAGSLLTELRRLHGELAARMGCKPDLLDAELGSLSGMVGALRAPISARERARLLAHGELLSTRLGAAWLRARGLRAKRVDARELLLAAPQPDGADHYLSAHCDSAFSPEAHARLQRAEAEVVLTQGFIARDARGETVLLGRGGSDASAAYLAAAIGAEGLEVRTDVPGLFSTDPRHAHEARRLRYVSYAEAEALAALGGKVLHPRTIAPLRDRAIPLYVACTAHPEQLGTRIGKAAAGRGIKAVVTRRELALITMTRPSSWQPIGFMAEVAACFQKRGLSMDLLSSSCSEIRATLDLAAFPSARSQLDELRMELSRVSEPRVVTGMGSVSLIGSELGPRDLNVPQLMDALSCFDIELFSGAANRTHFSFVVQERVLPTLAALLHKALFGREARVQDGDEPRRADLELISEEEAVA
jgi:diaminopimelate decarboxylase/aspartate kinase